MTIRSCQSCLKLKIRCTREVPRCQRCIKRGEGSLCVYETRGSGWKPALQEPWPKQQKQKQEQASGKRHIRWSAFEPQSEHALPYETRIDEEMQHAIEPIEEADIKHLHQRHSERGDLAPQETSPKSIAATIAEKTLVSQPRYGRTAVEDILEWPRGISVSQPTGLYAQMTPPVIKSNLQERSDHNANCQQDLFASTAEF
jgi:hypothetical protein